jgi:hypothetical protein
MCSSITRQGLLIEIMQTSLFTHQPGCYRGAMMDFNKLPGISHTRGAAA